MKPHRLKGVFVEKNKLYTKNLNPKISVYGESLIVSDNLEYRKWDPRRSKLAAAIKNGLSQMGIVSEKIVLYLGAASGTTVSHVSDIVGAQGFVFAVDFAPRVVKDLVFLAEQRSNIAPILADAKLPEAYVERVTGVDVVFQDIAQRDQLKIFINNCNYFLKQGGFGILTVKSRSIDVAAKPKEIFADIRKKLESCMRVVDYRVLEPFEKDHAMFVCKKL